MDTTQLRDVLEAVQQLSTEIVMILLLALAAKYLVAMTFSGDLLLIGMALFGMHLVTRHQTVHRMAESAHIDPLYTDAECQQLLDTFVRGLLLERGRLETGPASPPEVHR